MENRSTKQHGTENIDAELTGVIYEAALDPNLWPDLLEALTLILSNADSAEQSENRNQKFKSNIQYGNTEEKDRFSRLLPHFHRAEIPGDTKIPGIPGDTILIYFYHCISPVFCFSALFLK